MAGGYFPVVEAPEQMEWIPRWMSPYYDTASTYRRFWESSFPVPIYQMKAGSFDYTLLSWYGGISCPRQAYVARHTSLKQNTPDIVYMKDGVETDVKMADTQGTFLSEWSRPIAFWDGRVIHFRNLDLQTVTLVASGGDLNLTSSFSSHPMLPDSPLMIIRSDASDLSFMDASSVLFDASTKLINVGTSGTFNVSYLSTLRKTRLLAGTDYITIGGVQVDLIAEDLPNIWDDYAKLMGTWRRPDQDNLALKVVCQHLSIAKTPAQRISAALEQSWVTMWSTGLSSTLSLAGSGAVEVTLFGEAKKRVVREHPIKDGGDLVLSQTPTRYVQLFFESLPVDPDLFTLSSSHIILDSPRILSGEDDRTVANYGVDNYSETRSGNYITQLNNVGLGLRSVLVFFSRKVQVEAVTKTNIAFKWNRRSGVREGSARFD